MKWLAGAVAAMAGCIAIVAPAPASATFPGRNGKIAFGAEDWHLWAMNPDGSDPQRLTTGRGSDVEPAFSADGRTIAFDRDYAKADSGLHVMNADGSDLRLLPNGAKHDCCAAFSPDGRKIAFYSQRSGTGQIWLMNPDGSGRRQLTHGRTWRDYPAFSPDGRKIAFDREDEEGGVSVVDVDGTHMRRLTRGPYDGIPTFSPNGRRILFVRTEHMEDHVWVMNADGTHERRLTNEHYSDLWPTFSPDGTRIAFVRFPFSDHPAVNTGIFTMHIDGSHKRRLTATTSGRIDWQPLARTPAADGR